MILSIFAKKKLFRIANPDNLILSVQIRIKRVLTAKDSFIPSCYKVVPTVLSIQPS
jgi:hypothetical protein